MTQRYKATIEYDGTGLVGWQRQENGPSVQQYIEEALHQLTQENTVIQGSGRTDAGVHARGQVAHFDIEKPFEPYKLQQGMNFYLQDAAVAVLDVEPVHAEFNARFDATQRVYEYHIINRSAPLSLDRERAWHVHVSLESDAMYEAAQHLVGKHDFTSFRASECQAKTALRTIDYINLDRDQERIVITVAARSFLHHMVRNIVGTLHQVGVKKWAPEHVKKILEEQDRKMAGPTAPACGLYLTEIHY